jgi:hypothetical protein
MIRSLRLAAFHTVGLASACLLALPCTPARAADDASGLSVSLDMEALFLHREGPESDALFRNETPGLPTVLDANDYDFDYEPGAQGRLAVWLGSIGVEARGFWTSSWSDGSSFDGVDTCCQIDTPPAGHYGIPMGTGMNTHYESNLHGVDLSALYRLAPGAEILAGAKWLDLDEELRFEAVGFPEVDTWNAWNQLIGPQLGARLDLLQLAGMGDSRFSLGLDLRTALLFNDIHTRVKLRTGGGNLTGSDDENQVSASVEGGLRVGFELMKGVTLHAGYQALWVHDAATATRQVSGSSPSPLSLVVPLDTQVQNVLYHGATVGVTIALP